MELLQHLLWLRTPAAGRGAAEITGRALNANSTQGRRRRLAQARRQSALAANRWMPSSSVFPAAVKLSLFSCTIAFASALTATGAFSPCRCSCQLEVPRAGRL